MAPKRENQTAATRSKQTVSLERVSELMKKTLDEPNSDFYCSDDITVVVTQYKAFLLEIAPVTKRLNPASVSMAAKDVFKLSQREANQFGGSVAAAFSHCMLSGSKAVTGVKLHKDVLDVFNASLENCKLECPQVKLEVKLKAEPQVKKEVPVKRERGCGSPYAEIASLYNGSPQSGSPERPAKMLAKTISSPEQLSSLYGGYSSNNFQVSPMHACVHMCTHRSSWPLGGRQQLAPTCLRKLSLLFRRPGLLSPHPPPLTCTSHPRSRWRSKRLL